LGGWVIIYCARGKPFNWLLKVIWAEQTEQKGCGAAVSIHCASLLTDNKVRMASCAKDIEVIDVTVEDEEVAELMAGSQESLPTEDEENEADEVQRDTPLSAEEYFAELVELENKHAEAYYQEVGKEIEEEYKRVTFPVDVFPKNLLACIPESGIINGKIAINRYLSQSVGITMYRLMKTKWDNIIREPVVNMSSSLFFDLDGYCSYHEWCVPEESKNTCTRACIKLVDFENSKLSEYIHDHLEIFFCQTCDTSIINNYCNWNAKLCGEAATALQQKNVINTLFIDDDIKFQLQVEFDGLLVTSFSDSDSEEVREPEGKRKKTDE